MSILAAPPTVPTVDDVDRIAALPDPVLRNLQITQCYHELSTAVAATTGDVPNWCTFATWASKQVGQTIRHEDLDRAFAAVWAEAAEAAAAIGMSLAILPLPARAAGTVWETVARVVILAPPFARASAAGARGNRKVFEEIAREFAQFVAVTRDDPSHDPTTIATFCAGLRPGAPPAGQHYLRQAFSRYYQARFEPDPKRRAELVLLANVEVGLHEQTRLQPEIAAALNAAVADPRDLRSGLLDALLPVSGLLRGARAALTPVLARLPGVDAVGSGLTEASRIVARRVLTEALMTLTLPGGERLSLGRDLVMNYPELLATIENPDLFALLVNVDPTPDSLLGTGTDDWANLGDRMHFIADMFRACAEQRSLLAPPFAPEQVAALRSGRIPHGQL